jgi:hypothetical protein
MARRSGLLTANISQPSTDAGKKGFAVRRPLLRETDFGIKRVTFKLSEAGRSSGKEGFIAIQDKKIAG